MTHIFKSYLLLFVVCVWQEKTACPHLTFCNITSNYNISNSQDMPTQRDTRPKVCKDLKKKEKKDMFNMAKSER